MQIPRKKEILHASPPPVGKNVLAGLDEAGHRNNCIAYHIQKMLWEVFAQIDYHSLPDPTKVALRHLQSIAFEGRYPQKEDIESTLAVTDQSRSSVSQTAKGILERVMDLIAEQEKRWGIIQEQAKFMGFNGNGDQVRMWQDNAAVDLFANDFGGRIALFGSARLKPDSPDYRAASWLSRALVEGMVDITGHSEQVVTGAGPGIMEAGNRGALLGEFRVLRDLHQKLNEGRENADDVEQRIVNFRKQVHSAGIRIILPFEAGFNNHLQMNLTIKNFGPRKQGLVAVSSGRATSHDGEDQRLHNRHPAIFGFKGGFGTADEVWEVATLLQCQKMKTRLPIILVGRDISQFFVRQVEEMIKWGTVDPKDEHLLIRCDNEVEAVRAYLDFHKIAPTVRMEELLKERHVALHSEA